MTQLGVARLLAVLCGAAVLSLLSPPANLHWLHWVAYLPMFWALREETPRANRWMAYLYGVVGVGLLFRWIIFTIVVFSPIPWIGAAGVLLLFSAVFGAQYVLLWPAVFPLRRRFGLWWVVLFPALEVLLEFAAMRVLLFPYNHGVSQYRVPYTWQIVSVTGVWGSSYLVFLVNAALAEVIYARREGRAIPLSPLIGAGLALAGTIAFGVWRFHSVERTLATGPVLRVAQLQSDKDMEYRMSHSSRSAFEEWLGETRKIAPDTADLVVWPEGACPYDLNLIEPGRRNLARELLQAETRRGNFELAVGGGTRIRVPDAEMGEDRVQVFNSVYFFQADGTVQGHYDKLVPLPFGEYLPFGKYFPDLARTLNIGDFRAGEVPVLFDGARGRIATPICYEAILPGTCRLFRDADLFVVVTNDAWFGNTANPHQHAMLAATRAVELGIPMFRSAYTGVSLVVEPHGVSHSETTPFEPVNRVVEVRSARVQTIYARFGDWFIAVCALGLGGALGWDRWRRRAG